MKNTYSYTENEMGEASKKIIVDTLDEKTTPTP
jgi:hypothetical protein